MFLHDHGYALAGTAGKELLKTKVGIRGALAASGHGGADQRRVIMRVAG